MEPEIIFPCHTFLKVFGPNTQSFIQAVQKAVKTQKPETTFTLNPSKGDKYVAVSCEITFETKQEYTEIHTLVSQIPGTLFVL